MERWQITHIRSSLSDLISFTDCNTKLLAELKAAGLLADVDVQAIRAERQKHDKAYLLYEILQTRTNGYHGLIRALIATKQSGAAKILLHLSPTKIGFLKISLQDAVHHVSDLLSQNEIQAVSSWISSNLSVNECLKIHESIQATETLELVRDTIPKPYPLYIPRLLSRRLGLNPDIFEKPCSDVFVFKQIEQPQLQKFVKLHTIASSSEQLLQRNITSRFLLLDCDNDWNRICDSAKSPVHLIKYDEFTETFLLETTTGGSIELHAYLQHYGESDSQYVCEEAFIEIASSDTGRGICICDSPGMGKTLLLANIARKARDRWPERIVGFIQLQHVVSQKDLLYDVKMKTLELISTSALASQILYTLYKRNDLRLELFFDGLDEVQYEIFDSITVFLKQICKDMPTAKVYVTSRPVVRADLEKAFGMIAYDIQPFNEETQIRYLTNHWSQTESTVDINKLAEYAKYCIRGFQHAQKESERNIAGVPLTCWLLAKVYSRKADTYADTSRNNPINLPNYFVNSLCEIFKKFISRQLGETKCKFACMHKYSLAEPTCDTACLLKSFHVWKAFQQVFPHYSVKLGKSVSCFDKLLSRQILAPGLLEKGQQNSAYTFMHRTFAEYLVAEYFAQNFFWELDVPPSTLSLSAQTYYNGLAEIFISDKAFDSDMKRFARVVHVQHLNFCNHSFFRENVVVHFLDALILQNCEKVTIGNATISPFRKTFFDWIEACLYGNYPGLLNLLIQSAVKFISERKWTRRIFHKLYSFWNSFNNPIANVLLVTATYSDKATIENLFQFFEKVINPDLPKALEVKDILPKTVKLGIARGNYELVRYLLERFPFTLNHGVFHSWVVYVGYETKQDTLKILDWILANNNSLLEERFDGLTPLLYAVKFKNLETVNFLLLRDANIFAVDPQGHTILHIAAKTHKDDFFLKIVCIVGQKLAKGQINATLKYSRSSSVQTNLSKPTNSEQLFNWPTNKTLYTPLHYALEQLKYMKLETLDLLLAGGNETQVRSQRSTCVNIDAVDMNGETALHMALKYQRLELVQLLIARGSDWTIKTNTGCNALHICARIGTEQQLKYLLELGCNVNELDSKGNNALQCALDQNYQFCSLLYRLDKSNIILDILKASVLIDAGVNTFNKNFNGNTSRELATSNGWPEDIMKLLFITEAENKNSPQAKL